MSSEVIRHRVQPLDRTLGHWKSSGSDEFSHWVMEPEVFADAGRSPTATAAPEATTASATDPARDLNRVVRDRDSLLMNDAPAPSGSGTTAADRRGRSRPGGS